MSQHWGNFFHILNRMRFTGSIGCFKGEKYDFSNIFTHFKLCLGTQNSNFSKVLRNTTFHETPVLRRVEMTLKIDTIRPLEVLFALKIAFPKRTHVSMLLFPLFVLFESPKMIKSYLLLIYSSGLRSILHFFMFLET